MDYALFLSLILFIEHPCFFPILSSVWIFSVRADMSGMKDMLTSCWTAVSVFKWDAIRKWPCFSYDLKAYFAAMPALEPAMINSLTFLDKYPTLWEVLWFCVLLKTLWCVWFWFVPCLSFCWGFYGFEKMHVIVKIAARCYQNNGCAGCLCQQVITNHIYVLNNFLIFSNKGKEINSGRSNVLFRTEKWHNLHSAVFRSITTQ